MAPEEAPVVEAGPAADVAPEAVEEPPSVTEVFMQLLSLPGPMVTGADWASVPLLSFKSRVKLVPVGRSTFQVNSVPEIG